MEKIKIENVTKIFGNRPEEGEKMLKAGANKSEILEKTGLTVGVSNANLSIEEGQIFVIMGLSGSGKSTLLRMINRLIRPTSGHIYIDGEDICDMNQETLRKTRQEKMAMVFQNFGLLPHKTVLENVGYGLRLKRRQPDEIAEKAASAIATVGLSGYEQSYPNELSGGMQQRVGLARALANDTGIFLMDEAFSALDPLIRKDMQDELLAIQEDIRKTIVFITHDLNEALKIGDRIAIMRDGEIIQVGTPEEILTSPADEYVERFIEDATFTKVISVSQIMRNAYTVLDERGPRVALQMMRKHGISDIFIVNKRREVVGIITAKAARDAIDCGCQGACLRDFMEATVPTVELDTTIDDAIEVATHTRYPIAVVDEHGRLEGTVVKGTLLGAMSGQFDECPIAKEGDGHAEI